MEDIEGENIKDLVCLAKAGNSEAFGRLYELYFTPVFRYSFLRTRDKVVAENISQNVFLKSFKTINKFQERGRPFLAYLFTIARNEVIDYWKKPKNIQVEDVEMVKFGEDKLMDLIEHRELDRKILEALEMLTEEKKEIVSLKFFGGLKSFEIGVIIDKSEEAVRQIQYRALKELKEFLL